MANVNSRSYHGQKKRKTIGSRTLAASAGAVTVEVDASKGDLFKLITTAGGTGATPTFNVVNAHDGQRIDIYYQTNDTCDGTTIPVQLEGSVVVGSSLTAVATVANVNFIRVHVSDADAASGILAAYAEITT